MVGDLTRYGRIRISGGIEVRRARVVHPRLHTRFNLMVTARQVIAETRNEGGQADDVKRGGASSLTLSQLRDCGIDSQVLFFGGSPQ